MQLLGCARCTLPVAPCQTGHSCGRSPHHQAPTTAQTKSLLMTFETHSQHWQAQPACTPTDATKLMCAPACICSHWNGQQCLRQAVPPGGTCQAPPPSPYKAGSSIATQLHVQPIHHKYLCVDWAVSFKKDVTKGHASNYVATDPSHGGTQPARKGADCTNVSLGSQFHQSTVQTLHSPDAAAPQQCVFHC